jgi:hypothetical protein
VRSLAALVVDEPEAVETGSPNQSNGEAVSTKSPAESNDEREVDARPKTRHAKQMKRRTAKV